MLGQLGVEPSPYFSTNCFYSVNILFCISLWCSRYKNRNVICACIFSLFLHWNQTHDNQIFQMTVSLRFLDPKSLRNNSFLNSKNSHPEHFICWGFFKVVLELFCSWRFFHYWLNGYLAWWQQHLTVKDNLTKCLNKDYTPGIWGTF